MILKTKICKWNKQKENVQILLVFHSMFSSRICNIDFPVSIRKLQFSSLPPLPVHISPSLLGQQTKLLQLLVQLIVNLPPPPVCRVTRVHELVLYVPVTVIVPVTQPWLQPQVMYRVQLRRVRPEQPVILLLLERGVGPEVLQVVNPSRKSVPPHEDLVEEALVASVVRNDVVTVVH